MKTASNAGPLVTVMIPLYNHAAYIAEAVNSIIRQTYKNIELIVIDDGSKDNSFEKLTEYKTLCDARFVNVIFKQRQNKGIIATLNEMIDLSNGKYLYLIASDDMAKPNAVEKQCAFLEDNPQYVQVMGDNEIVDENSEIICWNKTQNPANNPDNAKSKIFKTFGDYLKASRKEIDFNSNDFGNYQSLTAGNYIPNGNMFLKNAVLDIGKYNENAPLEDWYLNLQISKKYKIKYLDEVLFSYRWHSANTMKNKDKIDKMIDATIKHELNNAVKSGNKTVVNALYKGRFVSKINLFGIISFEKYKSYFYKHIFVKILNKHEFPIYKSKRNSL